MRWKQMKLGDKVTFKKELKRVTGADSFVELGELEEDGIEHKWLEKYKEIKHQEPQKGIVVGKRRVGLRTLIELVEGYEYEGSLEGRDLAAIGNGVFHMHATEVEYINIYLVASNLRGLRRVLPEDIYAIEELEGEE